MVAIRKNSRYSAIRYAGESPLFLPDVAKKQNSKWDKSHTN